jgi:hypothetical protein
MTPAEDELRHDRWLVCRLSPGQNALHTADYVSTNRSHRCVVRSAQNIQFRLACGRVALAVAA